MSDDILGVVLDAGSKNMKAGFAGEPSPRAMLPTTVARFRRPGLLDGVPHVYCGAEAIKNRGVSNLVWPVRDGIVQNWDEMEKLWHHVFYKELHVPPESLRIMHTMHPLAPEGAKEKTVEILFESFAIRELYLAKSPSLVLHAYGRTSGIVWESGYACSYAAPVFEGFPLKYATVVSNITGKLLTERLQKLMAKTGYSFTTPYEIDLLDQIKKDICYVAKDYENEIKLKAGYGESKVKYYLPDGQHVLLAEELFSCPEAIFRPELEDLKCRNIIDAICYSIDLCDIDYKNMFYRNIVLSGGSTMFKNLVERLKTELLFRLKKQVKFCIQAMDMRQYAAWAGGSMLASTPQSKGFWFTREEYEDAGVDRAKYKFF